MSKIAAALCATSFSAMAFAHGEEALFSASIWVSLNLVLIVLFALRLRAKIVSNRFALAYFLSIAFVVFCMLFAPYNENRAWLLLIDFLQLLVGFLLFFVARKSDLV
jgi:Flp pilus assembly protein protease CpaA